MRLEAHRPRSGRKLCLLLTLLLSGVITQAAKSEAPTEEPIFWRGFQQTTLRHAARVNKPIVVYLTATWCLPCRALEEEVFSQPEVSRRIREGFIPIRVDRDRRPDLYDRYNRGGLPSLAFLLPSGNSMFFQDEAEFLRAGGPNLTLETLPPYLDLVKKHYRNSAKQMEKMVRNWLDQAERARNTVSVPLHPDMVDLAANAILRLQDPVNGGFRGLPREVRGEAVQAALEHFLATGDDAYRAFAKRTLDAMARGAVRNPLDGLFYRVAHREDWGLPAPERLLDTQADMLLTYLDGYRVLRDPLYLEIAEELVDGLLEHFYDPELGVFLASLIPESVTASKWTWARFRRALRKNQLEAARLYYGMDSTRRDALQDLRVAMTPEEVAVRVGKPVAEVLATLEDARERLRAARTVGEKADLLVVSGWSAETAKGLLQAWVFTQREDALEAARNTLRFIEGQMTTLPDGVFHSLETDPPRVVPAVLLADQIHTARANFLAFQVTGDSEFFDAGRRRLELVLGRFADANWGGLVDRRPQWGDMGEEGTKDRRIEENAEAAVALFEQAALAPGDPIWKEARKILEAFADEFPKYGLRAIPLSIALHRSAQFPEQIIVVDGEEDDSKAVARELRRTALAALPLWKVVLPFSQGKDDSVLRNFGILPGEGAAAYRIKGSSHRGPYRTVEELEAALASEEPEGE